MRVATLGDLVAAVLSGGCYRYAPVEVHAIGALSGRPLPGVEIRPEYARFGQLFSPRIEPATTDKTGKAVISVAANYKTPPQLFVRDHYLDQPDSSWVHDVPADLYRNGRDAKAPLTLKLLTIEEYRQRYPSR